MSVPANAPYNNWKGRLYSRNNVFVHLGTTLGGDTSVIALEVYPTTWELDMDYDVFMTPYSTLKCVARWTDKANGIYRWYSPTEIENGTFSSVEGIEQHGRGLMPTFADPSTGDLHLSPSDTTARDAGLDVSANGVNEDLDGTNRPQGAGFDRGCYER